MFKFCGDRNDSVPKATAISARSISVSRSSMSLMIEKNSSFVTNPVRNGSKIIFGHRSSSSQSIFESFTANWQHLKLPGKFHDTDIPWNDHHGPPNHLMKKIKYLPSWINRSWKSSNFHSIICLTESFKKYWTPFSLLLLLFRSSSPFLGGACFEFGNAAELKYCLCLQTPILYEITCRWGAKEVNIILILPFNFPVKGSLF